MSRKLQTVHVRVMDAKTGEATPVRIRFADGDDTYYAPFGRLGQFATGPNQDVGGNVLLGMTPHAYIDGACEIALPPGQVNVRIAKGPEYTALEDQIDLHPGKLALRMKLQRWIDMRERGWYSGDIRAHCLSPHAALLEAAAEDLAVVNLLVKEYAVVDSFRKTHASYPNLLAFSGQRPVLERPGHLVAVNTLNQHPELGSLGLLNAHRVVYPLVFGGVHGPDDWTMAAWCDQCHRKNGLVVWAHTTHESEDFVFGEPLADAILGKVDAFEMDFFEDSPFDALQRWYTLLDAGVKMPVAGGSGKDSNGKALGVMRTYAQLAEGEALTYASWIEAVRAGRTFATNAPLLLDFRVNGEGPGSGLNIAAEKEVHVQAAVRSAVPFEHLEIVVNGEVGASAAASGTPSSAEIDCHLPVPTDSWIAVRCRGQELIPDRPANQRVFLHTSPIYVAGAKASERLLHARHRLALELEKMLAWAREKARCENDQQRQRLIEIFADADGRLRTS